MSRLGSPQASSRRVAVAKPKNDIYVALLAIALGAVIIACILLAMEMSNYEWSVNPKVALLPARTNSPFDSIDSLASWGSILDQGGSLESCIG